MSALEVRVVLARPSPAQLRAALALGYHAALKGPFGLALVGGQLVVTALPDAMPRGADASTLQEIADAWRRVLVGDIDPGPRTADGAIAAAEGRIRSAILNRA